MKLDANGYTSTFNSFVKFAQQRVEANDAKAIADATVQRPLGGRSKVFNLFCPLATSAEDHQKPAAERYLLSGDRDTLLGRILRHFDGILALEAKGRLTAKNVIKICFPDMGNTGNFDLKAVTDFLNDISDQLRLHPNKGGKYFDINGQMKILMNATGCSLKEAEFSIRNHKPIPPAKYVSAAQASISDFGTVRGGRKMLADDLYRPADYSIIDGTHDILTGRNPNAGFHRIHALEGRDDGRRHDQVFQPRRPPVQVRVDCDGRYRRRSVTFPAK